MLETIFGSILTAGLTGSAFVICLLVALALGALVAAVYMYKNTYTQSMAVTLALLPAMVQVIILLVNGNLGAGVAVSGAFSLVRFRSAAGSARDIDKAVEHTVRQEAKAGESVSITVTSRSSGHAERLREHIDDRFRQSGDERNPPEVRVQPPEKPGNAPGESRQSESAEQV